jgi:hypothetical protein
MALKLLKAVWFLSMMVALGALLYVYAGLPQLVVVQDEGGTRVAISNEAFFYLVMMCMAVTNVLVFIMAKVFSRNHDLRTWFYGLITSLNIFFIVGVNFISVYNSAERFDYDRIAFVIYGSVLIMVIWALAWPVYLIFKHSTSKSLV